MFVNFTFKLDSITTKPEDAGKTIPQQCGEIFYNHFKGCEDYVENNVLVNFENQAPAEHPFTSRHEDSATLFVDMAGCKDLDDVMLRFQKALIEFMQRTVLPATDETTGTIILPQKDGAIG